MQPARLPRFSAAVLAIEALLLGMACQVVQAPGPQATTAVPSPAAKPATAADVVSQTSADVFYVDPARLGIIPPADTSGTLVYAASVVATNLDPQIAEGRSEIGWRLAGFSGVYDPLVHRRLGPDVNPLDTDPICRLCDSWSLRDDGKTYTFELRDDILWHDGTPFTAEDVAFSIERAASDARFGATRTRANQIDEYRVINPHTIELVTVDTLPDFLIDMEWFFIVPKHILEADDDALQREAVGTGPFKLVSFERDREALFERNEDYWVEGRPWLDGIRVVFGMDRSAQTAAFIAGQIHFLILDDDATFGPVRDARPQLGYARYEQILANGIAFNVAREPWDRRDVRMAMHMSVDRQALSDQFTGGASSAYLMPNTSSQRPYAIPKEEAQQLPGYRSPKSADIAEARKLLSDAGFADGITTSIMAWAAHRAAPVLAEAVAPMAGEVGIEIELEFLETGVANERWTRSEFDLMARVLYGQSWPSTAFDMYKTGSSLNFYGISDAELDALIDEANREMNQERRYELLRDVQRRILDQAWQAPLIDLSPYAVWNERLHNFRVYTLGGQPHPMNGVHEVLWVGE